MFSGDCYGATEVVLEESRSRSRRRWIYTQGRGRECKSSRELSRWEMTVGSAVGVIKSQRIVAP